MSGLDSRLRGNDKKIFGISVEASDLESVVQKGGWIITANPEILLYAKRHAEYRSILNTADQRTADGFGLWAMLKLGGQKAARLTGVDLSERLLQEAWDKGWKVGLFGGQSGEAEASIESIQRAYPELQVLAEPGGMVALDGSHDVKTDEAMQRMIQYGPQVLLVAFGHPKQEMWIAEHRQDFPDAKFIVGVGGTFNFWSGRSRRAPILMQALGIEWLWRLITEPKRWRRIFDAVFVFPFMVLFANR